MLFYFVWVRETSSHLLVALASIGLACFFLAPMQKKNGLAYETNLTVASYYSYVTTLCLAAWLQNTSGKQVSVKIKSSMWQ